MAPLGQRRGMTRQRENIVRGVKKKTKIKRERGRGEEKGEVGLKGG